MTETTNIIVYILLFISLYFEVFLLITYFEKRLDMHKETELTKNPRKKYPSVTIIVPCWNEEATLSKTIHSLLNLNYPQDKLKIMIVDDGSTDRTWEVAQKFRNKKQVEIYKKENGGKHTALNFGISKSSSELLGCLDADSYVDKDALKNIVTLFDDKETMAVAPSVKVWQPKTVVQLIQKVEYSWGIFIRKMLSYIGALYVTPGPFSIFRREVFESIGGYRHAHQTEDMEMALRMQANRYKIATSHNAFVYTVAPKTFGKLYKQRLRWTYGFLKNVVDYKFIFFKKQYGNLGILVLPMATLSIFAALYLISISIISFIKSIFDFIIKIQAVGFYFKWPKFELSWFSINTEFLAIISIIAFLGTLTMILISRKMSDGKAKIGADLIYFLVLYTFMAPVWMAKAVYNAIFSVKTHWR